MMTSSNWNIFRITGPLCGAFTGHRWIPFTKASDAEIWCFLWSAPWINDWVSNREAGDLRRHRAHYDVMLMCYSVGRYRISLMLDLRNFSLIATDDGFYLNIYSQMCFTGIHYNSGYKTHVNTHLSDMQEKTVFNSLSQQRRGTDTEMKGKIPVWCTLCILETFTVTVLLFVF